MKIDFLFFFVPKKGTTSSIWLAAAKYWYGSFRDTNETLTFPVCARTNDSCCASTYNIEVKACFETYDMYDGFGGEGFFAYYLPPPPSCPMGYCAGKLFS